MLRFQQQSDGQPLISCPPRSPYPMNVSIDILRDLIVNHSPDLPDIQPPGSHISPYQDISLTLHFEAVYDASPLKLGFIPMENQGLNLHLLFQELTQFLAGLDLIGEDKNLTLLTMVFEIPQNPG